MLLAAACVRLLRSSLEQDHCASESQLQRCGNDLQEAHIQAAHMQVLRRGSLHAAWRVFCSSSCNVLSLTLVGPLLRAQRPLYFGGVTDRYGRPAG